MRTNPTLEVESVPCKPASKIDSSWCMLLFSGVSIAEPALGISDVGSSKRPPFAPHVLFLKPLFQEERMPHLLGAQWHMTA